MKQTPYIMILLSASFIGALPSCKPEEKTTENTASLSQTTQVPAAPDTPETAVTQIAKLQNDMAAIMESITDAATAEAALPRISALADEFSKMGNAMKKLNPEMTPELETKLEGIMKPAMERMQNAIAKAMPIITQDPGLAKRFQEAMDKMR
jgi:hypothetical protein